MKDPLTKDSDHIWKVDLKWIALAFYALGFIYSISYYSWFDISIIHYLSLSEILLLSIHEVTRAIVILLFLLVFAGLLYPIFLKRLMGKKTLFWLKRRHVIEKKKNKFTELDFTVILYLWFALVVVLIVVVLLGRMNLTNAFFLGVFGFCLPLLMVRDNDQFQPIYLFFSVLFVMAGLKGAYDAEAIESSEKLVSFVYLENYYNTLHCSQYSFIGETSSTIFLFDNHQEVTLIFDRGDVVQLKNYKVDPILEN